MKWDARSEKYLDSLGHSMEIAIRDDGSVILLHLFDHNLLFIVVKQ